MTHLASFAIATAIVLSLATVASASQLYTTVGGVDKQLAILDPESGDIDFIGPVDDVQAMAWDGHDIYSTQRIFQNQHTFVRIDHETAAVTPIATLSQGFTGMTYDATRDVVWGVSRNDLMMIERETGDTTLVHTFDNLFSSTLAYDPVEDRLLVNPAAGDLFEIDLNTFELTAVGSLGMITAGLAYDGDSDQLFAVGQVPGMSALGIFDRNLQPFQPFVQVEGEFPSSLVIINNSVPAPACAALISLFPLIRHRRRQ